MKKTKRFIALLLSVFMLFALAACGGGDSGDSGGTSSASPSESAASSGSSTSSGGEDSNTITIWCWDESFNVAAAELAAEYYEADNPDVEVNVVTMTQDDVISKLNTALSAGNYSSLPNIVLCEDYRIQYYLEAYTEEFMDMSDVVSTENFMEYKVDAASYDGTVYGVPFDSGVAALFYRLDLVEETGYTEADMQNLTWDKYIEVGQAVKAETGVSLLTLDPSDIGQIRIMMQSAGSWYVDENGEVNISDNQALADAFSTYKKLIDSGLVIDVSDWDGFVSAFNNGEVASVPSGCWVAASIKNADDQSGKWAVTAIPSMAENDDSINASNIGGAGWYAFSNVDGADAAKDFLTETFASNTDLINDLCKEIELVSTMNGVEDLDNYQVESEYFNNQIIFEDLYTWQGNIQSVNYGKYTYQIEDIMCEALQEVLNGADIGETLDAYQTQVEAAVGS